MGRSPNFEARHLGYAMGIEVAGLDLSGTIDEECLGELRRLWLANVLVCFRDQHLDPAGFRRLCSRFGELDDYRHMRSRHPEHAGVMFVNSAPIRVGEASIGGLRFGEQWHSDNSYALQPAEATFLFAQALPGVGGDTMFANLALAYERLSPRLRSILDGLSGVHDYTRSGNFHRFTPEQQQADRALYPPVVHPAVRIHPETGQRSLFIDPRVRTFAGMTEDESRPLLDFLCAYSIRPEFVYRHRWKTGDVVMWDNRSAIHVAVQDYDHTQLRCMLRCTTLGPKTGAYLETNAFSYGRE